MEARGVSEVFISYSKKDLAIADRLAEGLTGLNIDVWYDKSLRARQEWRDVITRQLNASQIVIAIWSSWATTSKWVKYEADVAFRDGRLISLVCDSSNIPAPFSEEQALDFTNWKGDPDADAYLDLVEDIGEHLQRWELKDFAIHRKFLKTKPEAKSIPRRRRHYTYRDMLALCDQVRDEVRTFDPDVMFSFDSRGGIWAEMFFDLLTYKIPVIVGFRLKNSGPTKSDLAFNGCHVIQTSRWNLYLPPLLTSLPKSTKVLFVDDYSHTGETCHQFKSCLIAEFGWEPAAVRTLTLITSAEARRRNQRPDIVAVEETADVIELFYMFHR